MFIQTKNGTRINHIQTRSKNKHKKYDHSTLRNRKKLSAVECLSKLQYSVDLYKKRNEKSVTARSISEIKQQIHKLRTQSIQLNFSPLMTERSTSCGPQNNQTNNYPKGYNNILQIINTQTQSRIHKTKDMLPKITSNKNYQHHDPYQDTQKVTNFNKTNQPYLISSIVRVPRIVDYRIKKQAHSDQSNPTQVKINESISRWQPSQIQEFFLREMSNLR